MKTARSALVALVAGAVAGMLVSCGGAPGAPQAEPQTVTVSVTVPGKATVVTSLAPTTVTEVRQTTSTVTVTQTPDLPGADSDEPPSGLAIGKGVTVTMDDGSGTAVVNSVKRVTQPLSDYTDAPKNGNYLIIDVTYECTSGTFRYNPFDWAVRDTEGRSYEMVPASGSGEQELDSGELSKGRKARGVIVIDAPKGALSLEYTPGFGAPATWVIPA